MLKEYTCRYLIYSNALIIEVYENKGVQAEMSKLYIANALA